MSGELAPQVGFNQNPIDMYFDELSYRNSTICASGRLAGMD
jgi:hypothetical protein